MIVKLFEEPADYFEDHLNVPDNNKILFSGIFGTGKTTFLKWFFSSRKGESKYKVFRVSPVHYSVLDNNDIVTYLKYDLLYMMLEESPELFEEQIVPFFTAASVYLQFNFLQLMSSLLLLVPQFGKQAYKFYELAEKHKEDFLKIKKRAESDLVEIQDFKNKFHAQEGNLYESNIITDIINGVLEYWSSEDKETVLIIDDLDRLEPSQIFRIINVFSAHLDQVEERKSKFDFDKIILVCDENNLRNIFHNKYGQNVNYSGYIDKFYSSSIFHFDNRNEISIEVEKIIDNLKLKGDNEQHTAFLNTRENINMPKKMARQIFSKLIFTNLVNLRTIIKYYEKTIKIKERKLKTPFANPVRNWEFSILLLFDFLVNYFGDVYRLNHAFILLSQENIKISDIDEVDFILGESFAVLDAENHKFKRHPHGTEWSYKYGENSHEVKYTIGVSTSGKTKTFYASLVAPSGGGHYNHFEIINLAFERLIQMGYY